MGRHAYLPNSVEIENILNTKPDFPTKVPFQSKAFGPFAICTIK